MPNLQKSWQAPSFTADAAKRQSWVEEACIGEAESWLKGQSAYSDIKNGIDVIAGRVQRGSQVRSDLNINHAKFDIRKIVAVLSDVRPGGMYTSDAKLYQQQAGMMNRVTKAVALESQFPWQLRKALQYMAITACGYIWPRWTRVNGFGEPRVEFVPLGLLDVLPVQLPADNNLQGAYSVTIVEFVPVWLAHGKYPAFQSSLLPIARRRYDSTVTGRRLDFAERFKYGDTSENWANLYCEIRHTFIHDRSINETDAMIPMGEQNTSWYHEIPYVGQEIPSEVTPGGERKMRKAEPEDCLLYPTMRLITTSKGMKQPMYDGPAKDWSGMIPLARYCADDWVWEPCGFSLVHDIFSQERSRQYIERGMDQICKARLDPGIAYDRGMGLNDVTAQVIDPFEERKRLGVDGDPKKVFSSIMPEEFYTIPTFVESFTKYLRDSMDAQLGLNEMSNLAEFKANLQSDQALDKALSLVGPLVKDISANMENSTVDVWNILKWMVPQYMTTKRVMQYIGPDKISPQTFDFDPGSLIPSHGLDELANGKPEEVIPHPSIYSNMQRAKVFASNLRLVTVPHQMHEITQTQEQLKYLQLFRGGFPIAPHDVAKKLNIENYGELDGDTIFDRWVEWEKVKLELAAKAQELASSLMPQGAAAPGGPAGPHGGQKTTGGRPPSGKQPGKIKQKTGGASGPRTTVSESG